uniref:Uncharacterized protein n=1 Tax=Branchiostoma floridae TaxID=7739 RepID=C3ZXP2_BRAFL|eukprot:XP_002586694.1 hypothetical protein BRAFLDRAFT_105500 [Branchiostoma floridae]
MKRKPQKTSTSSYSLLRTMDVRIVMIRLRLGIATLDCSMQYDVQLQYEEIKRTFVDIGDYELAPGSPPPKKKKKIRKPLEEWEDFGVHAGDQLATHPFLHFVNCETIEKKNHVQSRRYHLATQKGGGRTRSKQSKWAEQLEPQQIFDRVGAVTGEPPETLLRMAGRDPGRPNPPRHPGGEWFSRRPGGERLKAAKDAAQASVQLLSDNPTATTNTQVKRPPSAGGSSDNLPGPSSCKPRTKKRQQMASLYSDSSDGDDLEIKTFASSTVSTMSPRKKKSRKCTGCGGPVALHPPGTNGRSCQGIPPNLEDQLSGGDGKGTPSDSPKTLEDLGARKAALLAQLKVAELSKEVADLKKLVLGLQVVDPKGAPTPSTQGGQAYILPTPDAQSPARSDTDLVAPVAGNASQHETGHVTPVAGNETLEDDRHVAVIQPRVLSSAESSDDSSGSAEFRRQLSQRWTLGLQFKNDNKSRDMADIHRTIQTNYVPSEVDEDGNITTWCSQFRCEDTGCWRREQRETSRL